MNKLLKHNKGTNSNNIIGRSRVAIGQSNFTKFA